MIFRVCKTFRFEASHRLFGYDGPCKYPHGHSYRVSVTLRGKSENLDDVGMLTDFSLMSAEFKTWIDDQLDHRMILCDKDPLIPVLERQGAMLYIMPGTLSTSAESLAWHLLETFSKIVEDDPRRFGGRVEAVRVQETETAWAEVSFPESHFGA